nr:hypothetical protein [Tanacetum cinerariifolium]
AQQTSPTTHSSPSLPPIPTEPLPTVILTDTPQLRHYTTRAKIAQSSALLPIADEPVSPIRDDSQGEACPIDSGLKAYQDRANILNTFTLPSDSTPRSEMVSMFEAQELEINSLKARIKLLEDKDGGVAEQSGDDAIIKGRRLDEGDEAAKRVSDDTKEMTTVLTSMDTVSILTSGGVQVVPIAAEVATVSVSILAGSGVVLTAEKMVESDTPKKKKLQKHIDVQVARELEEEMARDAQRMNEQIARDAEIARIHAEEELKMLINGLDKNNETESVKKLKTSEEVKATKEVPEEKVKEMMQLVPVEEVYVEALQVKHLIINWKIHTEVQRSYWKIIRLGGSLASYQFFVDMLKHLDREDLNKLWGLVKENLSIRPATSDKENELWVELKILFEPDVEDYLWTHTQYLLHASVEWKLYDTCRVHHVSTKDQDIFMLIEKNYPMRKSLVIVMISYKLQVENYSQMANDLILKIYKIANCPRQQNN